MSLLRRALAFRLGQLEEMFSQFSEVDTRILEPLLGPFPGTLARLPGFGTSTSRFCSLLHELER